MNLSRKCQYALKALFELAWREEEGSLASRAIAKAQRIPANFLELILKEMRQAGWVDSSRGPSGGYALAVAPSALSMGEVIRFIDGPFKPVRCMGAAGSRHCAKERCAFAGLWDKAETLLSELYDKTTLQDIVDEQRSAQPARALNFSI